MWTELYGIQQVHRGRRAQKEPACEAMVRVPGLQVKELGVEGLKEVDQTLWRIQEQHVG